MARRTFATIDALLIVVCVVIFAGGVLAQSRASGTSAPTAAVSRTGDRP